MMNDPVLLLPDIAELREKLMRRGHNDFGDYVSLPRFAASLHQKGDVSLMLSLIESPSPPIATKAQTAAYYEGGLTGFGDIVIGRLERFKDTSVALGSASELRDAVIECHDSTALRALHRIADFEQAVGTTEAAEDLLSIEEHLGQAEMNALALQPVYDGSHIVEQLRGIIKGRTTGSIRRRIWQLKQFARNPLAVALLSTLIGSDEFHIPAAFVLYCFGNNAMSAEQVIEPMLRRAIPASGAGRNLALNLLAVLVIQSRSAAALNILKTLASTESDPGPIIHLIQYSLSQF